MTADRERLRVAVLSNDPQRNERLAELLDTLGFSHTPADQGERVDVVVAAADQHAAEALEDLLRMAETPSLVAWGEPVIQRPEVCGWLPAAAPTEAVKLVLELAHELSTRRRARLPGCSEDAARDMEQLAGLAALGEAALQLNHDINNPLCSISLNAQLLLMSLDGKAEQGALEKIRSIETNADRIRELTETLTDTKRRSVHKPSRSTAVDSEVPA